MVLTKGKGMKLSRAFVTLFFSCGSLASCTTDIPAPKSSALSAGGSSSANSTAAAAASQQANGTFQLLPTPSTFVSIAQLSDPSFRVSWFVVGLASHIDSKSPVLNYKIPEQADFVQLLRCRADNAILQSIKSAVQDNRPSDSWESAKTAGCKQITQIGISQTTYLDVAASSDTYRYVIRSCIDGSRYVGAITTAPLCSNYLNVTPNDLPFQNTREQAEQRAYEEANKHLETQNQAIRQISNAALEVNNAKAKCQQDVADRQKALAQQQGILKIVGVGLSVVDKIMGDGDFMSIAKDLATLAPADVQASLGPVSSIATQVTSGKGLQLPKLGSLTSVLKGATGAKNLLLAEDSGFLAADAPATSAAKTSTTSGGGILPVSEMRQALDAAFVAPQAAVAQASAQMLCPGEIEANQKGIIAKNQLISEKAAYEVLTEAADAVASSRAAFEGGQRQ